MNKQTKYAITGAVALGAGNATLNAINQLNEMKENPLQKFSWKRVLIALLKGGAVGGAGGFVIGAIEDYENSLEKPINTNAHLYSMLSQIKLNKNDDSYIRLRKKAELLSESLYLRFKDELKFYPQKGGSTENGTALKSKFDIDIYLQFKAHSYNSTKEMMDILYSFLEEQKTHLSISEIRDQKVSLGLFFNLEGKSHKIDVVPIKITKGKQTAGYLCVNEKSFWQDSTSYKKTDIRALSNLRLTKTQQDVVVILKNWKIKNDLPLSSHLLSNLVIDAYSMNYGKIPIGITQKVTMVLKHIAENLDVALIRGVENSNNIITDIGQDNKSKIINACSKAIEEYNYQPNSIVETLN